MSVDLESGNVQDIKQDIVDNNMIIVGDGVIINTPLHKPFEVEIIEPVIVHTISQSHTSSIQQKKRCDLIGVFSYMNIFRIVKLFK